jgi:uncharacterized protein YwqG
MITRESLAERLREYELDNHLAEFEAAAANCIRLELTRTQEENGIPIGTSKIGGRPDLPSSLKWPKETKEAVKKKFLIFEIAAKTQTEVPLSFIAQINLADVSRLDSGGLLPETGMLYFFYSADQAVWGFDPKDRSGFEVLYFDGNSPLKRTEFPEELPHHARYRAASAVPSQALSFPDPDHLPFLKDDEVDRFFEMSEEIPVNKMFGYADVIQGEMELECELVTNGIYAGDSSGYRDPRVPALKQRAKDWILLLQVDSNEKECQMMWGDLGRIYYWIRKDDLLNRRFDRSWLILQCT